MIRYATQDDLPAIVSIYNQAVACGFATADTAPVTAYSRHDWFIEHEPAHYPIFVWQDHSDLQGWCSVSPYRPGRMALRFTAEISYYVHTGARRKGVATGLIRHTMEKCPSLQIKNLFAIVLEHNLASRCLLEKLGFERWGFLPGVADFDGKEYGHLYYGCRIVW